MDYQEKEGEDPVETLLTFEIMLRKVNVLCNNSEIEDLIGSVLEWKIHTDENMLKILIDLDLENIATKHMFTYP